MHARAFAGGALNGDGSVHEFDQPLDDGQAKPSALVIARKGVLDLPERLENVAQPVLGDADARVRDAKVHAAGIVRPGGKRRDVQGDRAALREFDGVAHQIEEYLAHPHFISDQDFGHARGKGALQGHALLSGRDGEKPGHGIKDVLNPEGRLANLHPARLHPGEVEDVRQESGQAVAGLRGHVDVAGLFGVERRGLHELQHAHDPVDGGTYLVAHVGQKFAFRLVGGLRLRLCMQQGFLTPFLFRDVPKLRNPDISPLVWDVARFETHWVFFPVFADSCRLIGTFVSGQDLAHDQVSRFFGQEHEAVHSDQFIRGVAGYFGESLIAVQDDALVMNGDAAEGGVVQDLEALLAFPEFRCPHFDLPAQRPGPEEKSKQKQEQRNEDHGEFAQDGDKRQGWRLVYAHPFLVEATVFAGVLENPQPLAELRQKRRMPVGHGIAVVQGKKRILAQLQIRPAALLDDVQGDDAGGQGAVVFPLGHSPQHVLLGLDCENPGRQALLQKIVVTDVSFLDGDALVLEIVE
ncbi:hypothetical protein DSECCO2_561070 [anaerobic digester metagenome]